jgi:hypothetical protein
MVMTLKGRSPEGGSHRKNSAVLEALFEMIERSAGLKLVVSFSFARAGRPMGSWLCRLMARCLGRPFSASSRRCAEQGLSPTDADHRCINLSQRGSHHQAHSGLNQCDSKALRREANVPRNNLA